MLTIYRYNDVKWRLTKSYVYGLLDGSTSYHVFKGDLKTGVF